MFLDRFRRHPGRSGRALRPVGPPSPSPPRHPAGEPGRSELADETEAFLAGRLAELRSASGDPLAAWMILNRIAHGDSVDMFDMAVGQRRRTLLTGVPSAYHQVWSTTQSTIASRVLERALDTDEIRRLQHDVLVPLELELITRSHDEPLTFAQVTVAALDALDHHHLDR
jgi:hypothetical protein